MKIAKKWQHNVTVARVHVEGKREDGARNK